VRAVLIAALGINEFAPEPAPAVGILLYYGMFFLLAIPFLHLPALPLFAFAALFTFTGPVLVHLLRDVLPVYTSLNPTSEDLLTTPGTVLSQLLLTGTYPALPYLSYLLAGLGLGRLHLAEFSVQLTMVTVGVMLM
jgi:uncharacterized membrane protein